MGLWLAQRPKTASLGAQPEKLAHSTDAAAKACHSPLLQLPSELLEEIFSRLECQSLVSLSRTSQRLRRHAKNDLLWATLLRPNLPSGDFPDTPYPSASYRELYISHHPYWFLPRYKIWFSDDAHIGKIMLVKFDPRRGCIEGYRLLADRGSHHFQGWSHYPGVIIHSFTPRVHMWLDDPLLKLDHDPEAFNTRQGWWDGEIKMKVGRHGHNTSASFFLSRDIPPHLQDRSMGLWPPTTIPNMPRVRNVSRDKFRGHGYKPQTYRDISQTTFRMRQWSQFSIETTYFGVRIGEEVSTWSTLDPSLYTPTKQRPYQGIYVGDYAGHGCEFLLVTQTDKAPDPPQPPEISQHYQNLSPVATRAMAEATTRSTGQASGSNPATDIDGIFSGAIEAIKLTGDPNVPRGEHTFIADDIGPGGFIRNADESPFRGARVVKSRGHVADRGFEDDEYIISQLFLICPGRLAHYWVPFGHVSFYERVDINHLLDQSWDRQEQNLK